MVALLRALLAALVAVAAAATAARAPIPQQITWLYSKSLAKGAAFLGETLQLDEVSNLVQKDTFRIFRAGGGRFVGVCDSREPPACAGDPEEPANPGKETYTLIVSSKAEVDAWHAFLLPGNGTTVRVTAPGESAKFACYAFNFYDLDWQEGLGCYRWEVQYCLDPTWPQGKIGASPSPPLLSPSFPPLLR